MLLTAFDSFGGRRINSSERFVFSADIAEVEEALGINIERRILPVVWGQATAILLDAISTLRPEAVLCFGEASGTELRLETKARNWSHGKVADNDGVAKEGCRILERVLEYYGGKLPSEDIKYALAREGFASSLSEDAGSFLCNEVFFHVLHFAQSHSWLHQAGFIYVPIDWELQWGNRWGLVEQTTKHVCCILKCVLAGN